MRAEGGAKSTRWGESKWGACTDGTEGIVTTVARPTPLRKAKTDAGVVVGGMERRIFEDQLLRKPS